jgi:hypothetical protein
MQLCLLTIMGAVMFLDNCLYLMLFVAAFVGVLLIGGAIIEAWNFVFNFWESRK